MKFTGTRDIAVTVDSLEKSRVFYEDVLGLRPKKVGEKLVVYETGAVTL